MWMLLPKLFWVLSMMNLVRNISAKLAKPRCSRKRVLTVIFPFFGFQIFAVFITS